jgi:D-tyrosyl-tRNA(Tyr) deacylase
VVVGGRTAGEIGPGLLVLLGVRHDDTPAEARWMAEKTSSLRVFPDEGGRMNRSLGEVDGDLLVVSQFTLYGDARKGRRPSYATAAPPEAAEPLYDLYCGELRRLGHRVETGEFGAMMSVELVNDGPVTLWIEKEPEAAG